MHHMPFKSQAQARMLYATNPKVAKEYARKTDRPFKSLPEHAKKRKAK